MAVHYSFRSRSTGKERDTESGLDYFGARYYGSTMGRWMSPDWASKPEAVPYASLDNPQSLNLYGYVNNNPLSKADPDGHCCEDEESEEEIREGESFGGEVAAVNRRINSNEFNEREQRINPGAAPLSPEQVEDRQADGRQNLHDMLHPNGDMLDKINNNDPSGPYKRPNNATTPEQRDSVQGKPCATCGATGQKNNADHKEPLVEQHYRGGIDKNKMRSPDAVRPQCTSCSAQQGGYLKQFSMAMKALFGFNWGINMQNKCNENLMVEGAQMKACQRYGAAFVPACDWVNSGLALATEGKLPINGLRHLRTADTTGWYLWCGEEYSEDKNFFQPIHTIHLYDKFPTIAELLGLPPGYRFISAGEYLDVWFDPNLLVV